MIILRLQDIEEVVDIKKTPGVNVTDQINVTNATECAVVGCYSVNIPDSGFETFHVFSPSCVLGTL